MKIINKILVLLGILVLVLSIVTVYFIFEKAKEDKLKIERGVFVIDLPKSYSGDNFQEISTGNFIVNTSYGARGTISIPVTFYQNAENIDFEVGCYTPEGSMFRLDAYDKKNMKIDKEASYTEGNQSVGFWGYFGFGSAQPFILSNNGDFGTHIDQVGLGNVRVLLFPTASGKLSDELNGNRFRCTLTIVSRLPAEREKMDFYITYVNN